MIPYAEISDIMNRTLAEVRASGHDPALCVWELSPSIWQTICDYHAPHMVADLSGRLRTSYMGVPVRAGITDEATGIILKQVWPDKWQ